MQTPIDRPLKWLIVLNVVLLLLCWLGPRLFPALAPRERTRAPSRVP